VSEQECIELARQHAEQRGWTWREPVQTRRVKWKGLDACQIDTHVGFRGVNVSVVVAVADGSILNATYMPR
jgi:hypothetical protein